MNTKDKDVLLVEKMYIGDPRVTKCIKDCLVQNKISIEDVDKVMNGEIQLSIEETETFFTTRSILVLFDFFVNKMTFPPGYSDAFNELYDACISTYDKAEILPTDQDFEFLMKFKYRVMVAIAKLMGIHHD